MSNAKQDMMKEIEAKIARTKMFAKQASRQKTIANWVADFFTEIEKTKKLDEGSLWSPFGSLALNRLATQLRSLDKKCAVEFKENGDNNTPIVEIRWTTNFCKLHNCEETLVLDASSAYFQSALEDV